jgi:hypothetical protein
MGQLVDGVLGLGLADGAKGEEDFTLVESRNDKKRKKQAAVLKKAAAEEKKAERRKQAADDERMAKIASKAATKAAEATAAAIRQAGGGVWANAGQGWRQPGGAQAAAVSNMGKGWAHHPAGGGVPKPDSRTQRNITAANLTGQVPAVVVFGEGGKNSLRKAMKALDPEVNAAISAVYKIEVGAPRAVMYCAEEDLDMVLSIIPTMRADGFGCAAYEEQRRGGPRNRGGAAPKAKQAGQGLRNASRQVGMCHYYTAGDECPHSRHGQCKFVCYDQQQQPQQPSARRGQPSGWRR